MSYLVVAILPSILLGLYVYKMDVIEKESKMLLAILFVLGVVSTIPALFMEELLINIFPIEEIDMQTKIAAAFFKAFFMAGMVEESYKWALTYFYTWKHKEFNHIYDAIVYAVFVSLGFATIENIFYVTTFGFKVGITRAIFSVPGHVFFAVAMGLLMGRAKHAEIDGNSKLSRKYKIGSLAIPIILHGIFNFCLFMESDSLILFYIIFVISLYVFSIWNINKIAKTSTMLYTNTNEIVDIPANSKKFCTTCSAMNKGFFCSNCGEKF